VYRAGGSNPGNLTPRPTELGVSVWSAPAGPAFQPEKGYVQIKTSLLPANSVIQSGPAGHYDIIGASAQQIKAAITLKVKGKKPLL
jgi:hypothetical protein